jgi:hypothetical protein
MRYNRSEIVNGTGFGPDAEFELVEDYNGWSNRETWAVALHINNDQSWQESVHETLRSLMEAERGADLDALMAGDYIREQVEQVLFGDFLGEQDIPASVAGAIWDIGSLWRVAWDELGAAFLADLAESSAVAL